MRLCVFGGRGRGLCVFGGLCVDMTIGDRWLVTNGYFLLFDCFWQLVRCCYTIGTVSVEMWRLVHQWSFLLFWLSFDCQNRKKMTIGVPIVTCLHRVSRIHKAAQTPLPCETSITCVWAVATARCPWSGLTVCVYMDVHVSGSRSLPRAATLFYQLMMPAARLVCQRPSSNFPYFRIPLANFLLSRPNSVEYGNSKTTTLLPSAKCTRPLFQGRTGCGGRPSGWHDIVTCLRLVYIISGLFRAKWTDNV